MLLKSLTYFLLSKIPFSLISLNLRVLAYHEVPDKEKFTNQVHYLKSHFNIISIDQLKSHFWEGQVLPTKPLLITFDDGDYTNFKNAYPVLRANHIPAIIFIISELINSENTFWCKWVEAVYEKDGKTYIEARKEVNRLKNISNRDRIDALNNLPVIKSKQLGTEEIQEMETYNIKMGNHTHTHPMINKCTVAEVSKEMDEVKKRFKQWEIQGYSNFAYPNGNFDTEAEEILISKGIKMAFLFDHKINSKIIDPMRISRIRVNSDTEINEFKVKVSGLHSKLMKLKQLIS